MLTFLCRNNDDSRNSINLAADCHQNPVHGIVAYLPVE